MFCNKNNDENAHRYAVRGENIEKREWRGEDRGRKGGIHEIITQEKDTKVLPSILSHKSEQLREILRI